MFVDKILVNLRSGFFEQYKCILKWKFDLLDLVSFKNLEVSTPFLCIIFQSYLGLHVEFSYKYTVFLEKIWSESAAASKLSHDNKYSILKLRETIPS
jgi:hypothetical protein